METKEIWSVMEVLQKKSVYKSQLVLFNMSWLESNSKKWSIKSWSTNISNCLASHAG